MEILLLKKLKNNTGRVLSKKDGVLLLLIHPFSVYKLTNNTDIVNYPPLPLNRYGKPYHKLILFLSNIYAIHCARYGRVDDHAGCGSKWIFHGSCAFVFDGPQTGRRLSGFSGLAYAT
jgi:hypothetical protein